MLKPRNALVGAGFLFLFSIAVGFAQQAPKPQTAKLAAKPKTNGSSSSHDEAKPAPDKPGSNTAAKDATATENQEGTSDKVDASQYVGSQACSDCHENVGGTFPKNPHAKTLANEQPNKQGCESCHGPGKAHAESGDPDNIVRFESVSKTGATKICATCHLAKDLGDAVHTQHTKVAVGCLECHSVHFGNAQQHWIKSEKTKLCSSCHENRQH